jgi:putative transposase
MSIDRPNYNIRMQRLQAFKYELRPDGQQERQMRRFAGSCRFVYNKGLALQKERYERGEKKLGYAGLCKMLTEWRNSAETAWLADAPVHPLQQALKDLERAYSNFFAKRADFPRFKKKGQRDSFRYPDPKQIKLDQGNSRIFLPKLGWLRYRNSREVLGTVRNVTVSQSCGKWFVSIQTEREVEQPVPQATTAVGIDMGVIRFATLSDGTFYAPLNSFKRHETALRKAQQAMSRKTKFSNNWKKAKARVQRIHSRIGNARRDFLHKTSTAISQNHAMVCIEDLQVRNMSRSAAGTTEARKPWVLSVNFLKGITMNIPKSLIRSLYDIQHLRIQTGNRIVAEVKARMGQLPGQKEETIDDAEAKQYLDIARAEYKRIADAFVLNRAATTSRSNTSNTRSSATRPCCCSSSST